jgi:signal transduction histidine kinase
MKSLPLTTHLNIKSTAGYLLKILALAVIYHLAARVGLKMAYVQFNTSPVWPPTGIALAALLIFGYGVWPGISLGVLLGSLLTGALPGVAVGLTVGNTLEALAGAFLLRRFIDFHTNMDRIGDVVGLAVVSVFATIISATIGTITLMLAGQAAWGDFAAIWTTWWIGDLLGALVVTPALLIWVNPPFPRLKSRQFLEGVILLILLITVTWYVFGSEPPDGIFHQALIYLVFPFTIWAALRLEQHGATLAIFAVSGIAIWGTVQGLGPFSVNSMNDSLVLLQTFTGVVSLTALILASAIIERRIATQEVQRHAEELSTLNDSSRTFLDACEIASVHQTICRLPVTRLGLDVAWIESPTREGGESRPLVVHGIPMEAVDIQKQIWEPGVRFSSQEACQIASLDDLPAAGVDATYKSFAVFPLIFGGQPIGALKLLSRHKDFFSEGKQVLIQSYANLAAVAIQNAWLFDEVRTTNRQLHALSQRLMKVQENERLQLSRELHDESGQLLAALMVQLGLLERDVDKPGTILERILELKNMATMIQKNLHHLAVNLRPASLDHLGLVTALQQYIQDFSRQSNIQVDFEAVGLPDKRLPLEIETALFRIVQEALTNVVLHAQAKRADVLLSYKNQQVSAMVEDDGVGFVPTSAINDEQLGLFGMRERVEMLGGSLTIESSPGKGTTVRAEAPCHD